MESLEPVNSIDSRLEYMLSVGPYKTYHLGNCTAIVIAFHNFSWNSITGRSIANMNRYPMK